MRASCITYHENKTISELGQRLAKEGRAQREMRKLEYMLQHKAVAEAFFKLARLTEDPKEDKAFRKQAYAFLNKAAALEQQHYGN